MLNKYKQQSRQRVLKEFRQLEGPNDWSKNHVARECLIGVLTMPTFDFKSNLRCIGEQEVCRYLNITGKLCNKRVEGTRLSVAGVLDTFREFVPELEFVPHPSDYYGPGHKDNVKTRIEFLTLPVSLECDLIELRKGFHRSKFEQPVPNKILPHKSLLFPLQNRLTNHFNNVLAPSEYGLSQRLYHSEEMSITQERREFREEILNVLGLFSYDQKSSQIAINAVEWNLPLIHAALKTGDMWESLGLEKQGSKKGLMRLSYGGDLKAAGWDVLDEWRDWDRKNPDPLMELIAKGHEKRFLNHPTIQEVYSVAQARIKSIAKAKKVTIKKARSLMACESQDKEFELVAGTLCDVLDEHPKARGVCWLHDGFTLDLRAMTEEEQQEFNSKLESRFAQAIAERGWHTSLVRKDYQHEE